MPVPFGRSRSRENLHKIGPFRLAVVTRRGGLWQIQHSEHIMVVSMRLINHTSIDHRYLESCRATYVLHTIRDVVTFLPHDPTARVSSVSKYQFIVHTPSLAPTSAML